MAVEQRLLHIVTEFAAFFLAAFLVWVATRTRRLNFWEKVGLWVAAVANVVIDGYLLFTWFGIF